MELRVDELILYVRTERKSRNDTERMNHMEDSREIQDTESICSGKLSHVLSQPVVIPSPWYMEFAWYIGKRF